MLPLTPAQLMFTLILPIVPYNGEWAPTTSALPAYLARLRGRAGFPCSPAFSRNPLPTPQTSHLLLQTPTPRMRSVYRERRHQACRRQRHKHHLPGRLLLRQGDGQRHRRQHPPAVLPPDALVPQALAVQ